MSSTISGTQPEDPAVTAEWEAAKHHAPMRDLTLTEHARHELKLLGEDPAYSASLVAAVAAFASYGHSGGSAMVAIDQLHELLNRRTLMPLTSSPDEWIDRSDISGYPIWQSARDPCAMSADGGATYWLTDNPKATPRPTVPAA